MSFASDSKSIEKLWVDFQERNKLSPEQVQQFELYATLLLEWNKKFNITAITTLRGVIKHHFVDSLILGGFKKIEDITTLVDVGAGGGFPAIPLKIVFPHLKILLIEVNKKKLLFL